MKHRIVGNRLQRNHAHRWSMLRCAQREPVKSLKTMVSQLLEHERIETTLPKARELRKVADKMVTLAKEGTLFARRQAAAVVRGDEALHKLFTVMAQRYADREGGYTRVLRSRRRTNDAAQMAYIEYIDRPGEMRPARPPQELPSPLLPAAAWVAATAP